MTLPASLPQATIALTALVGERVAIMATEVLGGPVDEAVTALLAERSEGNPLFVEQLLLFLRDEGAVQLNGRWSLSPTQPLSLPMDVRSLLVARLDRLPLAVRQLMQTAAVLGRDFALPVLRHMVADDVALRHRMATAVAAGICIPINDNQYQFRHILLRQAAYEMQLHSQRQSLHHQAALSLESVYASALTPHYADLAHHYQQANITEQAIHYLQLAGDAAQEAYQNQAASHFYGRALALLPDQAPRRRYELLLAHEAMCRLLGQREAQQQDLQVLAQIAGELAVPAKLAQVALRQANFYEDTGDYAASETAAQAAMGYAQHPNQPQPIARAHMAWGRALTRQSKHESARRQITLALNLAQQTEDLLLIGDCLRSLASIFGSTGRFAKAQAHYQRAREVYSQAQYRWGEAASCYNLGNNSGVLGDLGQARTYYEQALTLFREIGERRGVAWTLTALGNWHRWETITAHTYLEQAQAIFHEIGDRYGIGWVLRLLGLVAQISGNHAQALSCQAQCLPIFQQIGAQEQEAIAYLDSGYSYAGLKQWDKARRAYQSAQRVMQAAHLVIHLVTPEAGLARVALAEGRVAAALVHTEKVLAYLETGGMLPVPDELWIQWTCYEVLQAVGDIRAERWRQKTHQRLLQQAAQLPDDGVRQAFLRNVPVHRLIAADAGEALAPVRQ